MDRAPIDPGALSARWPRVDVVEEIDSTNAALRTDDAAPDRAVLVAEYQRAGRGRLDRGWHSPPRAGLTFSVLVRPQPPVHRWSWLPLVAGVALCDAVTSHTGVPTALKWPNDVLHAPSERKLAGILAQTTGEAVVIGIGLNVSTTSEELPVPTATSLELAGAAPVDRTALLGAILDRIDARLVEWTEAGGDAERSGLAAAYREACTTLGRVVALTTTAGTALHGRAHDIDSDGRLVLETEAGTAVIGAGDVEHLR